MNEMSKFERFVGHFKTITKHKLTVQSLCFKAGMYKQGILHDLSKYSLEEFIPGVKYYQGYRSPIDKEKETVGYSKAWLHHAGRNKHHWEYWIDKDYPVLSFKVLKMPFNYVLESCLDRIAACKIYNGSNYQTCDAYNFFKKGKDKFYIHPDNVKQYDFLLNYLKDNGEIKALHYYKELYKKWKKDNNFEI